MTRADPGAPARPATCRHLPPSADLTAAVGALSTMGIVTLQGEWRRLYRTHPPKKLSRDLLALAVGWKLQEQALGGLCGAVRRELAQLAGSIASGSDLPKARRVRLKPGARLVREWGGETHEVLVTEGGFVWRDRSWRSLSVIAREITGARWSGPRFFGLGPAGVPDRQGAAGQEAGADA
jgi:hypothetical protein